MAMHTRWSYLVILKMHFCLLLQKKVSEKFLGTSLNFTDIIWVFEGIIIILPGN